MRAALRELLFTEDKLYPPRLGNLAAWFDALDASSMLSGAATPVTDGGTVCLWKDKSGNSGVNALVRGGATGNSSYLATGGSSIGAGDFTFVVDFRAQPAGVNGALGGFSPSIPTGSSPGRALEVAHQFGTPANLSVTLYGATGLDFRYYRFVNYFSSNANLRKVITVTRTGATLKVFSDGVELTPDAEVTSGTSPGWDGSVTSTYTCAGDINTAVGGTDSIFKVRAYSSALSAANVLLDYQTGAAGARLVDIDFTTAPTKLANGDTFVCTTGQTVTLNSSGATGARIAGERDLFQGTAANRPVLLKYAGTKYGWLNGVAGNYFSTPDSAAVSVTEACDLIARVALADYTPSSTQELISKRAWFGGFEYSFRIETSGALNLYWDNGTGLVAPGVSTEPVGSTDWSDWYLRARRSINGANYEIDYFKSIDGVSWTKIGDTITIATAGNAPVNSISALSVSGFLSGTYSQLIGRVYNAQVWSGDSTSGGTLVADFNPALYTSGTTFTASTGEVWTINGGAHIVTRTGLYFNGTAHSVRTALFALNQPETVYSTLAHLTWFDTDALHDGSGTGNRMALVQTGSTPQLLIAAGGTFGGITSLPLQTTGTLSAVFNGASSTLKLNRASAAAAASAGTHNANGFTLGGNAAGTTFGNMFVSEVAIYSAAHGTSTQDRMAIFASRKWGFSV